MKTLGVSDCTRLVAGLICVLAVLALPSGLLAKDAAEAEAVSYNVKAGMQDNLKSLTGKRIYVTLAAGNTMAGTVKDVGNNLLHLEKLDGKEYFDALIRIESISAIDTRFRNFGR